MPQDYIKCRDALVQEGKPLKEAQRVCAIQYYKKHGKPLPRDSKSGLSAEEIPIDAAEHPIDDDDLSVMLDWMYSTLKEEEAKGKAKTLKMPMNRKRSMIMHIPIENMPAAETESKKKKGKC